jgi:hypothetical protein
MENFVAYLTDAASINLLENDKPYFDNCNEESIIYINTNVLYSITFNILIV